jgi:hypothetical protein
MMVSWYPYLFYSLYLLYVLFLVKSKIEKKPGYLDTIEFLQKGFWYPGMFFPKNNRRKAKQRIP